MSGQVLPSHEWLDNLGIAYVKRSFSPNIEKGAASVARELGFKEDQMVKTLIFSSGTGERVLVMIGGSQKAVSGLLKKAIGNRNIKMATPENVLNVCGYEIGSIPPFPWQPEGFRTFFETSLFKYKEVGVGTGQWGEEIIMTPQDLVRASGAKVVNLIDRNRKFDEIYG